MAIARGQTFDINRDSDTGFYSGQTSCVNMKVLIFAENFFLANLSYDQKC